MIQTNIEEPKKVETKENEVQASNEDIQSVIRETAEIKEDEPLNNNDNKEIDNKEIIEKKEVEKEIEIKNVVNEEKLIRQSIKEILNEPSTLPVIVREKVNQVIYDKNVTTLPLIYGETKITYLKEVESTDIGLNNLNGQNYLQVNEGIEYTQEINQNNFQVNQIQNYNIEPQDIQINEIAQSQVTGLTTALDNKLDASTFDAVRINGKTLSATTTLGGADIKLSDYTKEGLTGAVTPTDSVNSAIGKLENQIGTKQATLVEGKGIEINTTTNTISAKLGSGLDFDSNNKIAVKDIDSSNIAANAGI